MGLEANKHPLPSDAERDPVTPQRQLQILREQLAELSTPEAETEMDANLRATAIANTMTRIEELKINHPGIDADLH